MDHSRPTMPVQVAPANRNWDETRTWLTRMEGLYDRTQFFRRVR